MKAAIFLLFLPFLVIGCGSQEAATDQESAPEPAQSADPDIEAVGSGIEDVDSLDAELDDSDFDTLDEELAGLDW